MEDRHLLRVAPDQRHPLVRVAISSAWARPPDTIYDETLVPAYSLPEPLLMLEGTRVDSAEAWANRRRAEVLRLFQEHVHGGTDYLPLVYDELRKLAAAKLANRTPAQTLQGTAMVHAQSRLWERSQPNARTNGMVDCWRGVRKIECRQGCGVRRT